MKTYFGSLDLLPCSRKNSNTVIRTSAPEENPSPKEKSHCRINKQIKSEREAREMSTHSKVFPKKNVAFEADPNQRLIREQRELYKVTDISPPDTMIQVMR